MITYDITHQTEQAHGDGYDHTSVAEGLTKAEAVQWLSENATADLLYQFYVSEIDEDGQLDEQTDADEWLIEQSIVAEGVSKSPRQSVNVPLDKLDRLEYVGQWKEEENTDG